MSFCLYNKENITRRLGDMNFIFSWQKQYFTHLLRSFVKSKIKFISSHHHVISSIYTTFNNWNLVHSFITGKSQTEALMYWPCCCSVQSIHQSQLRFEIKPTEWRRKESVLLLMSDVLYYNEYNKRTREVIFNIHVQEVIQWEIFVLSLRSVNTMQARTNNCSAGSFKKNMSAQ